MRHSVKVLRAAARRPGRFLLLAGCLLSASALVAACEKPGTPKPETTPAPSASAAPLGLTPELGARVLARVGDRTITLAEYAAVLQNMDRFERLRYQTADRRKQLLDEMIQVELLAREAERRGLSEKPEAKEMVRQILRDAVLTDLRDKQPKLEAIPQAQVRAWYDAHREEFREPERRRVSVIALKTAAEAEGVLRAAKDASPKDWGDLVVKHGAAPKGDAPKELGGDLGFVTPKTAGKADNAKVPEAVREAVFEIPEPGKVLPRVVTDGKVHYVVRLVALNSPRDRTFEEAERTIRVKLLQEGFEQARAALEKELAEKYPVKIDEAALAKVTVPPPAGKP
jgi:peptidyl-prolyl cis-trans isomerase C